MFTQDCSTPASVLTLPLVFRRDWWKQKPKPSPWRTHPSFQRALYRKDTDYGLATWTPKSRSKCRSLSWLCAEVQCLLWMLRRLPEQCCTSRPLHLVSVYLWWGHDTLFSLFPFFIHLHSTAIRTQLWISFSLFLPTQQRIELFANCLTLNPVVMRNCSRANLRHILSPRAEEHEEVSGTLQIGIWAPCDWLL